VRGGEVPGEKGVGGVGVDWGGGGAEGVVGKRFVRAVDGGGTGGGGYLTSMDRSGDIGRFLKLKQVSI